MFISDPGPYVHRLAGFFLYVSNTTSKHQGHLCYKDETGGTPSVNQIISCSILGRYVIYYNERSQNHNPFYLSQYAYNDLCEVEVYGEYMPLFGCAMPNLFNQMCRFFLIFDLYIGCHGSFGEGCIYPCPTNCLKCDMYTGDCLSCLPGYQGQSCKNGSFFLKLLKQN